LEHFLIKFFADADIIGYVIYCAGGRSLIKLLLAFGATIYCRFESLEQLTLQSRLLLFLYIPALPGEENTSEYWLCLCVVIS
jgi:hypothetical protein